MNKDLNILFSGFLYEWNFPILEKIKNRFEVKNSIHIGSNRTIIENNYIPNYNREDLKFGYYYNNIDWNTIPPLDNEILNEFYECEVRVLEMISRVNDRLTLHERKDLYYKNLRYWLWKINITNINLFISDNIPHEVFDYVIYKICKFLKIKTIMFHELPSKPHRHIMIHMVDNIESLGKDIYEKYNNLLLDKKDVYKKNLQKELINYKDDMKKDPCELIQFTQKDKKLNFLKIIFLWISHNLQSFLNSIRLERKFMISEKLDNFEIINFFLKTIFKKVINFLSRIYIASLYLLRLKVIPINFYKQNCLKKVNLTCNYIYFPLHFQPELSTSPLAENYNSQELIISNISSSLPENTLLYVKEHPRISKNRGLKFYEDLLKINNVRFISSNFNSYTLIDNAIAVATATGSVGWEAFHRDKPVLMFGRRFYQYAPGVYKINSYDECCLAIDKIINKKDNNKVLKEKYLLALNEFAFRGYNSKTKEKISDISKDENINNHYKKIVDEVNRDFYE